MKNIKRLIELIEGYYNDNECNECLANDIEEIFEIKLKPKPFPKPMKNIQFDYIVFFTEKRIGRVIKGDSIRKIGDYKLDWQMDNYFEDCEIEVKK